MKYITSEKYLKFLDSVTSRAFLQVLKIMREAQAFDENSACHFSDIITRSNYSEKTIAIILKNSLLVSEGFVLSCKDTEKPNLTRYYLNKVHIAPVGATELESAVDKYYKEEE